MNLSNIISAGRMMALVTVLLGAVVFVSSLFLTHGTGNMSSLFTAPFPYIALGLFMCLCGVAMFFMFGWAERRPRLGTPILLVAILAMLAGVAAMATIYRSPFSWMMCILSLAIFVDALCLRISLSQR